MVPCHICSFITVARSKLLSKVPHKSGLPIKSQVCVWCNKLLSSYPVYHGIKEEIELVKKWKPFWSNSIFVVGSQRNIYNIIFNSTIKTRTREILGIQIKSQLTVLLDKLLSTMLFNFFILKSVELEIGHCRQNVVSTINSVFSL